MFKFKYAYNLKAFHEALGAAAAKDYTVGELCTLMETLKSVEGTIYSDQIVVGRRNWTFTEDHVNLFIFVCQEDTGEIIPPKEGETGSRWERVARTGLEDMVADMQAWLQDQKAKKKKADAD